MIVKLDRAALALVLAAGLAACGDNQSAKDEAAEIAKVEPARTCESIREQIVLLTERNVGKNSNNTIVKIYDPKTVKSEPSKVSCSGRAMLSNAQEATVYYRTYKDADGEWLIEYNEKPLEK